MLGPISEHAQLQTKRFGFSLRRPATAGGTQKFCEFAYWKRPHIPSPSPILLP